jgi:hypothetical protein
MYKFTLIAIISMATLVFVAHKTPGSGFFGLGSHSIERI